MLNWDLYHDLVREVSVLEDENRTLIRFMLLGKESLITLERIFTKVDYIYLYHWDDSESSFYPVCSQNQMMLERNDGIRIYVTLGHPHMKQVTRWALSSVKTLNINAQKPFPTDIRDLLLNNPRLRNLEIFQCDLPTTKLLVESRRFDYIKIYHCDSQNLGGVCIDTKELEYNGAHLEEILERTSIKTNSLICDSSRKNFPDDLITINIGPGFKFLEKLDLSHFYLNVCLDPQKILDLLEFFNEKLINLKLLTLRFTEHHNKFLYNEHEKSFNISPNSLKGFVEYEDRFASYKGKAKVEFNHDIQSQILGDVPRQIFENYYEILKEKFRDFGDCSSITNYICSYDFRKLNNVTENLEMNIRVHLFGSIMKLNSSLYSVLTKELLILFEKNQGLLIKSMIAGKEFLFYLKKFCSKVDTIRFPDFISYNNTNRSLRRVYMVELKWRYGINTYIEIGNPCMRWITRLMLSSVKRVQINYKDPLSKDFTDLLSKNPMGTSAFEDLNKIYIETEKLGVYGVPLKNILEVATVNANSLICVNSYESFDDSLVRMNVSPRFQRLEKLELDTRHYDMSFNPQKIFDFLKFLNKKFTNLKLLSLNFKEFYRAVYNNNQGSFDISPDSLINIVNYINQLATYNQRVKVKFNYEIEFAMNYDPRGFAEKCCFELIEKFQTFKYSFWNDGQRTHYRLKKAGNIAENFWLNISVHMYY
ncbi:hypothetical protein FO519_009365 [Halicephalobus sp. NKZ332]|nr:hypothetical protein FO519_009365 [Halicephalobus sp. NKZ332]